MDLSYANLESVKKIHEELTRISDNPNVIPTAQEGLKSWMKENVGASLIDIKADILQIKEEIVSHFFTDSRVDKEGNLSDLITAFIHSEVYDTLFSGLKVIYSKKDLLLYEKSKKFCKDCGTPKQLGSTFYNFIPNAAVVELSMLGNIRTPLGKLKCLQATYDYIFAEVKGALISVISKYSENEADLPLINNKEVFPIVMAVILKSKLFYLVSELKYINEFGRHFLTNLKELSEVYQVFDTCVAQILNTTITTQSSNDDKLVQSMSVCDTIHFIEKQNSEDKSEDQTVLNEEQDRVARLITSATTENLVEHV